MRFPGIFVYLCFQAVPAADPYRDPYGIWAGGFWPLSLFPIYGAAILLGAALYGRLGFLAPTFVQKCPTLAF